MREHIEFVLPAIGLYGLFTVAQSNLGARTLTTTNKTVLRGPKGLSMGLYIIAIRCLRAPHDIPVVVNRTIPQMSSVSLSVQTKPTF